MTIKKFIEELSKHPEDIELKDIPVRLAVEKEIGYNRIKSVYLGGYRIVGGFAPFGSNSVGLERLSNLGDVHRKEHCLDGGWSGIGIEYIVKCPNCEYGQVVGSDFIPPVTN